MPNQATSFQALTNLELDIIFEYIFGFNGCIFEPNFSLYSLLPSSETEALCRRRFESSRPSFVWPSTLGRLETASRTSNTCRVCN